jgi:hypothetical protein
MPPPEFSLKRTRSTNWRSRKREKAAIIVKGGELPEVPCLTNHDHAVEIAIG